MTNQVHAVIAALKVALEEAQQARDTFWKVRAANRWIDQLPGAWLGRWRHLKLRSEYMDGDADRKAFIGHVRVVSPHWVVQSDC